MNGDLGHYHLLYDEERQRLNGILDFSTAGTGDPACDFGCLLDQYGERFVRRVARTYPGLADLFMKEPAFGRAPWHCNGDWQACATRKTPPGILYISVVSGDLSYWVRLVRYQHDKSSSPR